MPNQIPQRSTGNQAVVLIGMEADGALDRNARRLHEAFSAAGLAAYRVDYDHLESIPRLTACPEILVLLLFPHGFWDAACEIPEDTGLYGTSLLSFRRFRQFFLDVQERLNRVLADRHVAYLVPPNRAFSDRDKVETIKLLKAAGVPVSPGVETRNSAELLDRLEPDRGIFIKCRFGAEGKGITFLSTTGWWTNYVVEGGRLGNHGVHGRWPFTEITGRKDLLAQLLASEVIIEHEIVTPEFEVGTKFDIRAYVSAGTLPHMFLRINQRDAIVTNFSQGARIDHLYKQALTHKQITRVRKAALAAARAMECPFAGIDVMFGRDGALFVVEAQVFTDFPDRRYFNLPEFLAAQIQSGAWRAGNQLRSVADLSTA